MYDQMKYIYAVLMDAGRSIYSCYLYINWFVIDVRKPIFLCFPPIKDEKKAKKDFLPDFLCCLCGLQHIFVIVREQQGCYCYSKMFHWEPEGRYHHRHCIAIAPF